MYDETTKCLRYMLLLSGLEFSGVKLLTLAAQLLESNQADASVIQRN